MFEHLFDRPKKRRSKARTSYLPALEKLEDRIVPNSMPIITNPGIQSIFEGNTAALQITASADPGGDPLTYSISGSLPAGLTIGSSTGLISGTVDYSVVTATNSTRTVTQTLNVAQGTFTASQTLSWKVTDTPLIQPHTWSISEAQTATHDPRSSAGQGAGGMTTYSLTNTGIIPSIPAGLTLNTSTGLITGTVDFTAASGSSATINGTLTASKPGLTEVTTLTWVVTNVPVVQANTWTINEGQTVTNDPRSSAGQSASGFTYSLFGFGSLPPGLTLNNSTGLITGTIDYTAVTLAATTATYGVNIGAAKGTYTDAASLSWVISATPLIQGATWSVTEGQTLSQDPRTSAGQGVSGLTYSISGSPGLPPGLTLNSSTGLITGAVAYTAVTTGTTANWNGILTASKTGLTESVFLTWIVTDKVPSVEFSSAGYTVGEADGSATLTIRIPAVAGNAVTVHWAASDGSALGGLDYTSSSGNATISAGQTAATVTIPITNDALDENAESLSIVLSSPTSATLGAVATATLTITDNDDPPTVALSSASYTVSDTLGTTTINATLSAASGLPVTVSYSTSPGTAQAGVDYTSSSGAITFSPGSTTQGITIPILDDIWDKNTTEAFGLSLSAPTNATLGLSLGTVAIINDDDPPDAVNDGTTASTTLTLSEDTTLSISVLSNDTDPESDALKVVGVTQGSNGSVAINANGTLTYTPSPDYTGPDEFTYTAGDGHAGFDTATVYVSVNGVNDAPVAVFDGAAVDKNTPKVIKVLKNDTDVEGNSLTVQSVTQGTYGDVSIAGGSLTVTYEPDTDYVGTDSFTYTVSDGNGGTDTETVYVKVYDDGQWANQLIDVSSQWTSSGAFAWYGSQALGTPDTFEYGDLPTAWAPDPINVEEFEEDEWLAVGFDTPVYATGVLIRETYGNGFVTRIDLLDAGDAWHEEVWAGTDTSNPDVVQDFVASFTETAYLVKGAKIYVDTLNDETAWEEIDAVRLLSSGVSPYENDAPSADGDAASVNEDDSVDIDVLDGDGDANSDPVFISIVSNPTNGFVEINDNETPDDTSDDVVTYTPDLDYSGTDSFTYQLTDIWGDASGLGTVTVSVTAVNDAPTAPDLYQSATKNTALVMTVPTGASDVESSVFTFAGAGNGAHGSATWSADSLTYTPTTGYMGPDQFTYTLSDGQGGTATATARVVVYEDGQWASSVVTASSQYGSGTEEWSASKVLGAPDVSAYGDDGSAWAPLLADGGNQTLTVAFTSAVPATGDQKGAQTRCHP